MTATSQNEELRVALSSVGAERKTIEELLSSQDLGRTTITIYSKGPTRPDSYDFTLTKLPEFLKWLEYKFPNGVVRWDSDFESARAAGHTFALKVTFSLLEDDQGARVMVRANELDEESYHQKIEELSYKKSDAVQIDKIVQRN
ncbi:MAG: hypothetical protein OK422_03020 [Thaumarchaeota archaeon]|nr:hypothetical protein [Nitrososphaerota archaeon]